MIPKLVVWPYETIPIVFILVCHRIVALFLLAERSTVTPVIVKVAFGLGVAEGVDAGVGEGVGVGVGVADGLGEGVGVGVGVGDGDGVGVGVDAGGVVTLDVFE